MDTAVTTGVAVASRSALPALANKALKASAQFWFVVAVTGQLIFAFYVAFFYGTAAGRGDFQAWNRGMPHGYVPGHTMGNIAVGMHLLLAVIMTAGGAFQIVPQMRSRFPTLHRWNGRVYIFSAFAISLAGLYMVWLRGTGSVGDLSQHLGISFNAVLIMLFAGLALRSAMARDFRTHRRWALRLFLASSGVWFFRVGLMLSFLIFRRPFGFDPATFQGPFLTFMAFATYLLPLAVLELYLRTQDRPGVARRFVMAGGLTVLTLLMAAGILGATMIMWMPRMKIAADGRTRIVKALSQTMDASGIDAAAKQYATFKAAGPAKYNLDEAELNQMGYDLLRAKRTREAIRIFQLNVEAYPRSSNAYDSLAEAFVAGGDEPQAIAHYQKALQLNPKNQGAASALQRLQAQAQ